MSHAITALLLLQLDRMPGNWVAVQHMAMHLSLTRPVVCDHLLPLAQAGQVWLQADATGLVTAAMSPLGDCPQAPPVGTSRGPQAGADSGPFRPQPLQPAQAPQPTTPAPNQLGRIGSAFRPAVGQDQAVANHP